MKKLFLLLALSSCEPTRGVQGWATNNTQVPVELLFSHDGCDVFRFYDGLKRYYVRCRGSASVSVNAERSYQCGTAKHPRTCYENDETTTIEVKP